MKPIDEISDALAARIRTDPSGAKSLAHVCVVVPTAQSGRRLRLALARRFGALVPPLVKTPEGMRLDESDPSLATRTDEIAAFRAALAGAEGALERARQLADLRGVLAAKALSFADVAAAIATDLPEEAVRWRELAAVETRYLAALDARGRTDRIRAMKAFRPDFPGVEEILRFDDPTVFAAASGAGVARSQVFPCATPADEADRIADWFAAVKPGEALPALCIADPELFPEIESAFKARGLVLHNPSRTPLAASSLGRLAAQLAALRASGSYSVFSAFVRGGDVRRWLAAELGLTDEEMTAALVDLDNRQAEFLPEMVDDIAPKTKGRLRAIFEFVKVQLRKKGLRALLGSIFRRRQLTARDPAAREFAAAAEVLARLIDECGDDDELFALRLDEATYSLEPDDPDAVLTDGWMELPFLEADELVVAGFREGCVPESVVGHPFLPDSLRRRLGLPDNRFKETRDRAIFRLAVSTRAPEAVRIHFHAIDAAGDAVKPSRLLFETDDDGDLVERVRAFYGMRAGTPEGRAADLPDAWRLRLPVPPDFRELTKISPTRLDAYLSCPFTFYLRDKGVLGDKRMDDRAEELAAWEYGNLVHEALEAFGNSELRDSTDAAAIRAFLEERVDAQLAARFGLEVPAIVALQGESAKRRLANFAPVQAARRAEGWEIRACERKFEIAYRIEEADGTAHQLRLHGKCDRIDCRPATNEWCVVDYKTWDALPKALCFETKADGTRRWTSVQLPLYCAMLDMDREEPFAAATRERITSCYCVLGKTKDSVRFTEPVSGALVPEAEDVVRAVVRRIERGVFWPPDPRGLWRYDYEDWLSPAPAETVCADWIADQERRART